MMREVLEIIHMLRGALRSPCSIALIAMEYAAFHAPPDAPVPFTTDQAIDLADRWFPDAAGNRFRVLLPRSL